MPTIITNSNRIDLVDPIKGKNKSITIDEEQQRLIVNDGTGESWDISGDTDESVGALARELHTLEDNVGDLSDLTTDVKTSIVAAINDTYTNATIGRAHANTIASQLDSLITQMNNWANNQLLAKVNSTVIAQGTTESIAIADWDLADYPLNPEYLYSLTIHTGIDSTSLADNPVGLAASGRAMFDPADLPNDKLAGWCEVNYNASSTEYEIVVWAKEPVELLPISWELVIGRNIAYSGVPQLALAKPTDNSNNQGE